MAKRRYEGKRPRSNPDHRTSPARSAGCTQLLEALTMQRARGHANLHWDLEWLQFSLTVGPHAPPQGRRLLRGRDRDGRTDDLAGDRVPLAVDRRLDDVRHRLE